MLTKYPTCDSLCVRQKNDPLMKQSAELKKSCDFTLQQIEKKWSNNLIIITTRTTMLHYYTKKYTETARKVQLPA